MIEMVFDASGLLAATDYFSSEAFQLGMPCCCMRDGTWHLLLPGHGGEQYPRVKLAYALPVRCGEEARGWQWRLWISQKWSVALPRACWVPPVPEPGEPGSLDRKQLVIYGHWLPGLGRIQHAFGSIQNHYPEAIHRAKLMVIRALRGMAPQLKWAV